MAGNLNPPEFCICGAKRSAIQEGRAIYKCGSRGTEWRKKLKLARTPECFEAVRLKSTVQNSDKADATAQDSAR